MLVNKVRWSFVSVFALPQHGYKLEWIVIYLICIEVLIEVVWNILIKDVLKWV